MKQEETERKLNKLLDAQTEDDRDKIKFESNVRKLDELRKKGEIK